MSNEPEVIPVETDFDRAERAEREQLAAALTDQKTSTGGVLSNWLKNRRRKDPTRPLRKLQLPGIYNVETVCKGIRDLFEWGDPFGNPDRWCGLIVAERDKSAEIAKLTTGVVSVEEMDVSLQADLEGARRYVLDSLTAMRKAYSQNLPYYQIPLPGEESIRDLARLLVLSIASADPKLLDEAAQRAPAAGPSQKDKDRQLKKLRGELETIRQKIDVISSRFENWVDDPTGLSRDRDTAIDQVRALYRKILTSWEHEQAYRGEPCCWLGRAIALAPKSIRADLRETWELVFGKGHELKDPKLTGISWGFPWDAKESWVHEPATPIAL